MSFIPRNAQRAAVHDVDDATGALRDATRLVVLTGAGASTESGVPDFRGSSGIWERFDPSEFQYERFVRDPRGFWELRAKLMEALDLENVRPNAVHVALAQASRSPRFRGHVTQNIDGLFHAAGHDEAKIVEAHGSARKVRCIQCLRFFSYDVARSEIAAGRLPPRCPECGGPVKPGSILFGERLHEPDMRRSEAWMRGADAVLVVGSSLAVHPVAGLPTFALERGARLVIVNRSSTPYDGDADAIVRAPAGEALPGILAGCGFISAGAL